jgi:hypothetical protein
MLPLILISLFLEESIMIRKRHLSYEEQFKEILNQEEIDRIENPELREIRMRYWKLRHKAFIDEHNIPDVELGTVLEDLNNQEKGELIAIRNKLQNP